MPEAALPRVTPPSRAQLVWFDLVHGTPAALAVLRRHLPASRVARVLASYLVRGLRDPLRDLPRTGWDARREALVRHQLRAVVRIDDALRGAAGLDEEARRAVLLDLVGETGARFIGANVPMPEPAAWAAAPDEERARFAGAVVQRFFNADVAELDAGEEHFAFDVTACRFAQLCGALGRPYLAPLFCDADAVFFERPDARLKLARTETIAGGGGRCDFRFRIVRED